MRKKIALLMVALALGVFASGCLQEHLVIPVATVKGKVKVPPAKDPLGVKITVAGNPDISTWVNEKGEYSLEFRKPGRYLLIARSRWYDVNYVWVDAIMEKTVNAEDIPLNEKIVGEALFIATVVDFPNATKFQVKGIDPTWATSPVLMYDDGTHGDKFAKDGIWTVRLDNLITGYHLYSLIWTGKNADSSNPENIADKEEMDPHREFQIAGKSQIYVREASMAIARGNVTSSLVGVNYSEVTLATKGGSRKINLNNDGSYSITLEGNGREYLVFRSPNFHIKAIPVDLSTVPVYDVPTVTLTPKGPGEAKFILIKSDFQDVASTPTVVADFTNWQPRPLYDDGTNGDEVKGDGVYTLLVTGVAPGYHKYAFNITPTNQVRDPYQESGDSQYSILLVK